MDRNALHHLIDDLPETEVGHVAALVEAVRNHDRVAVPVAARPASRTLDEDEATALTDLDSGETIPQKDMERRYGV